MITSADIIFQVLNILANLTHAGTLTLTKDVYILLKNNIFFCVGVHLILFKKV